MSTNFMLHSFYGSPWYVAFLDPQNVPRLLPVRKRWFGRKWTLTNCPKIPYLWKNVFIVRKDEEDNTGESVLMWVLETHQDVETYLEKVNSGQWILLDPNYFETEEFQRST